MKAVWRPISAASDRGAPRQPAFPGEVVCLFTQSESGGHFNVADMYPWQSSLADTRSGKQVFAGGVLTQRTGVGEISKKDFHDRYKILHACFS